MNKEVLNSYIKIRDIAFTANINKSTIKRRIDAGKYQYRIVNGNGGKQYEILVSSLEPELQQKVLNNYNQNNNLADISGAEPKCEIVKSNFGTVALAPVFIRNCESFAIQPVYDEKIISRTLKTFGLNENKNISFSVPQSARDKALAKVDILKKWEEHRNFRGSKNRLTADKEFEELFNGGFISAKLLSKVGKISVKSIYRWNAEYKKSNNNYMALIDGYNYGSELHSASYLSDIEKFMLLLFMLHQNKYSVGKAYELIKLQLAKQGLSVSGIGAYRRLWSYLCKNYSDMITFAREGKKAVSDKILPYIQRDLSKIQVGDVLVGDGHVLDFMVKNPFTGKPVRATLVAFMDWKSWEICGYELMVSENTQSIASALRNSILHLGKMPKTVYIDNGKAFKNKAFNGIKADFTEDGIVGIYEKLGIKVQYSKPYNGREKVIERFWKEFTNSFAKLIPSYIGNNIENQPASLKRNEKYHQKLQGNYIPTIEETKNLIETWLNNVYRKRTVKDSQLTVAEYFSQYRGKGVNVDILDDLLMASTERKIGRNGIRLFNELYYSPSLTGLDIKVIAKYNMFDLSYIKVYTVNGEYICRAERQISVNPLARQLGTPKDLQDLRKKQKQMKKVENNRLKPIKTTLSDLYGSYKNKQVKVKQEDNLVIDDCEQYQITCYEKMCI